MASHVNEDLAKSNWLKQAEVDLARRDPVDAVNDAEALLAICEARLDKLVQPVAPDVPSSG